MLERRFLHPISPVMGCRGAFRLCSGKLEETAPRTRPRTKLMSVNSSLERVSERHRASMEWEVSRTERLTAFTNSESQAESIQPQLTWPYPHKPIPPLRKIVITETVSAICARRFLSIRLARKIRRHEAPGSCCFPESGISGSS